MSPPPPPSPWEVGKGRHTYDVQGVPKSCQSCCKCRQRGLGVKKSLDNVDVICAWPPGKESIRQVTWFLSGDLKERREKMQLRPFKKVHSRLARNKTEFTERYSGDVMKFVEN